MRSLFSFRMISDTRIECQHASQEWKASPVGAISDDWVELSRAAQVRLAWMDFHRRTQNVALTCRHFGISRQTFYRWRKR